MSGEPRPVRKSLHHTAPSFVEAGEVFFLTVCAEIRGSQDIIAPPTARILLDSARFYHDSGRWWLRLLVLMPDHLHALVALPGQEILTRTVGDWKRYATRKTGLHWQKNFFDHRLRNDESLEQKAQYIRENPVRAGLCTTLDQWPWWTENR